MLSIDKPVRVLNAMAVPLTTGAGWKKEVPVKESSAHVVFVSIVKQAGNGYCDPDRKILIEERATRT